MSEQTFQVPNGLVSFTTHGSVLQETVQSMSDARSHCDKNGMTSIQWLMFPGSLVDKARNDAARAMLQSNCGWLLFVDCDMTFAEDAVRRILQTAYGTHPWADIVGGYCCLRGQMAVPTIDTGTGTWESHFPGSGVLEVIRTGAAFLLVKRHVFEALEQPWFRLRVPTRPVDFMAEVDNFSRCKFDGQNIFRNLPGTPWETLENIARQESAPSHKDFIPTEVGEDSAFCDRAKLAGFRIVVDTNIVIGHVHKMVIGPGDHKEAMEDRRRQWRLAVGVQR
jgi:hypothetical protein